MKSTPAMRASVRVDAAVRPFERYRTVAKLRNLTPETNLQYFIHAVKFWKRFSRLAVRHQPHARARVIAAAPEGRLRDIAATLGITERTAGQIVKELERAGYVTKTRVGRRNRYDVHGELPLRHPQHRHHTVGDLIEFLRAPEAD